MSNVHHSAGKRPVRPAPAPPRPSRGAAAAAAQVGGGGAAAATTEIASIARALTQDQDVVNMAKYAIYVMSDITGTKIENPQKAIEAALNMLVARGAKINNGKIELTADRHEIFACNAGENRSQTGIAIVRQLGANKIIPGALAAKEGMFSGVRATYHEDLSYYWDNNDTEKKLVYGHILNTESQETINAFAMQLLFDHTKEIAGNGEKKVETLHAKLQKARGNGDRRAISAVYEEAFDHYAELFHKESAKPLGITAFTDIAGINLILNLVSLAQESKVTLENVTLNLLNIDDPLGKCSDVSTTNIRLKKEAFESYEIKDKGKKPFKVIDTIAEGIITTVLALEINSKIVHNSSDAKEAADTMIMEKLKVLINTCFDKSKPEISEPETKHLILKTAITHLQNQPKLNPSFKTLISQIATNILPSFTVAFQKSHIYIPMGATAAAAATGGGGGGGGADTPVVAWPETPATAAEAKGGGGSKAPTSGFPSAAAAAAAQQLGAVQQTDTANAKVYTYSIRDFTGKKIVVKLPATATFKDLKDHLERTSGKTVNMIIYQGLEQLETDLLTKAKDGELNVIYKVPNVTDHGSTTHRTFNLVAPDGSDYEFRSRIRPNEPLTVAAIKMLYEGDYPDLQVSVNDRVLANDAPISHYPLDTQFVLSGHTPAEIAQAAADAAAAAAAAALRIQDAQRAQRAAAQRAASPPAQQPQDDGAAEAIRRVNAAIAMDQQAAADRRGQPQHRNDVDLGAVDLNLARVRGGAAAAAAATGGGAADAPQEPVYAAIPMGTPLPAKMTIAINDLAKKNRGMKKLKTINDEIQENRISSLEALQKTIAVLDEDSKTKQLLTEILNRFFPPVNPFV